MAYSDSNLKILYSSYSNGGGSNYYNERPMNNGFGGDFNSGGGGGGSSGGRGGVPGFSSTMSTGGSGYDRFDRSISTTNGFGGGGGGGASNFDRQMSAPSLRDHYGSSNNGYGRMNSPPNDRRGDYGRGR